MIYRTLRFLTLIIASVFVSSCNKDDIIETTETPAGNVPEIIIESETGVYTVKKNREITIAPVFKNISGGTVSWVIDGKTVCRTETYTALFSETGEYYVTIIAENKYGKTQEEIRIDVVELTPPVVELRIPTETVKVLVNTDYKFEPAYQFDNVEDFSVEWTLDGTLVGTEKSYLFSSSHAGNYRLTVKATNADGFTEKSIGIDVVEKMPCSVAFPEGYAGSRARYTFAGRPVCLYPRIEYFNNPSYRWSVNGVDAACESEMFSFTPDKPGKYAVTVTVTESGTGDAVTAEVIVECVAATEMSRYRAANSSSSAFQTAVFEYIPAPGQFIGEKQDFPNPVTSMADANSWAKSRLDKKQSVSLGSFGGYVTVGFDHSIPAGKLEYDFAIQGNAYASSNEPGIVWVMQDVNGNGLPDDEWYELRGSESNQSGTLRNYSVTYFRPMAPRQNIVWIDSRGNTGLIMMNTSHSQDSYFPDWITGRNYTLYGTRLLPRNSFNSVTGQWSNNPYGWGYADNLGDDNLGGDGTTGANQRNGFSIANAIMADGTPVALQYIDFVKVQCGVQAESGAIGELSTEVLSFEDLSLTR